MCDESRTHGGDVSVYHLLITLIWARQEIEGGSLSNQINETQN
jgi:hypothetical protein